MDYLLACKDYALDRETWKFVRKMELPWPFEMEVPFYFWKYKDLSLHREFAGIAKRNVYRKVIGVKLNDLFVEVNENVAAIAFNGKKGPQRIKLTWNMISNSTGYGFQFRILSHVEYTMNLGGRLIQHTTETSGLPLTAPNFLDHRGLGQIGVPSTYDNADLGYGLRETPYRVFINNKELNGTSYALICGTWAVLLSDDMQFDSLVFLQGFSDDKMYVDHVAYSVNPYVVKVITLGKR